MLYYILVTHISVITDINKLQTTLFMFKHKHNLIPLWCISYLSHSSEIRIHNTRNKPDFVLDRFKSTVGELSISIRGARLWNLLPDYLLDKLPDAWVYLKNIS